MHLSGQIYIVRSIPLWTSSARASGIGVPGRTSSQNRVRPECHRRGGRHAPRRRANGHHGHKEHGWMHASMCGYLLSVLRVRIDERLALSLLAMVRYF